MTSDLLSEVKLQKLKPTCLLLKQLNGALECAGRELSRLTRMPVFYFPKICYYVLKTVVGGRWFHNRNLMLCQRFGNQRMIICNHQTVELLQIDSNAVNDQNVVQFLCVSNVFSKNVTQWWFVRKAIVCLFSLGAWKRKKNDGLKDISKISEFKTPV